MNRTEMSTLLAHIAQIDNRSVSAADVNEWLGLIGDLTYDECIRAVAGHRRESTDWLMPAHIRKRALDARQDAAMRELPARAALPAGAPETFAGLPIPGAPPWVRQVYERAKAEQHEINRQRKADGLPPTFGDTVMHPSDGRIPRQEYR